MSYSTDKCLERLNTSENSKVVFAFSESFDLDPVITSDGVKIDINDDDGLYVSMTDSKGELRVYLDNNQFVFKKNSKEVDRIDVDHMLGLMKFLLYLTKTTEQKQEDGTVADLGIAPTGHVTHSVDCHDEDEEDDGW